MSTGLVEQWSGQNLSEIGAIYPFVGTEVLWFIVCVAIWLLWHAWQLRNEKRTYEHDLQRLKDPEVLKWAIHEDTAKGVGSNEAGGPSDPEAPGSTTR